MPYQYLVHGQSLITPGPLMPVAVHSFQVSFGRFIFNPGKTFDGLSQHDFVFALGDPGEAGG